jgi:hypothetical protein
LNRFELVESMAAFPSEAWSRYEENLVKPNLEARPAGAYAAEVRRRRRGGCPVHSA